MAIIALVELYREIADITQPICAQCPVPYKCCEPAGCAKTEAWARNAYGVNLVKMKGELPFLTATGCTVAPHHRMLCTLWLCADGEPKAPRRYWELRKEIAGREWARRWERVIGP